MHRWGNRLQVLIGLWILAGLTVLGVNGNVLMSLLDEPLAGYSSGVRNADRGFGEYRLLLTTEAKKITSGMDMLARRFAPKPVVAAAPPVVEKKTAPSTVENQRVHSSPVVLPVLAGILTRRTGDGTVNRLAMLDGGLFSEGDTIQDFTVTGISAGGVLLSRGKKTWRLPAPEMAYSLTMR